MADTDRAWMLVEFRHDAIPPTVVIATDHEDALDALRQELMRLADDEPRASISIGAIEGVRLQGLDGLLLVAVAVSERWTLPVLRGSRRAGIEVGRGENGIVITWRGRRDEWRTVAGLIDGVIGSGGRPGFQWLTGYMRLDPVDVVLSYRSNGRY